MYSFTRTKAKVVCFSLLLIFVRTVKPLSHVHLSVFKELGVFKTCHHICEQLRHECSTNVCCVHADKCGETLDSVQTCSRSSKHTLSVPTKNGCQKLSYLHISSVEIRTVIVINKTPLSTVFLFFCFYSSHQHAFYFALLTPPKFLLLNLITQMKQHIYSYQGRSGYLCTHVSFSSSCLIQNGVLNCSISLLQ